MKKADLQKILVEKYGYANSDFYDDSGKPFTNAVLKSMIEQEEADEEIAEANKYRITEKKNRLIKDTDKIAVMSGSSGSIIYRSDTTRNIWKWTNFGQIEYIPYGELVTILNRFAGYYTDGWLIVLDPQVQDEFGLTDMYENILTPQNIDEVFNKSADDLEVIINGLPDGMKNTFIDKARQLYEAEKLDSLSVIRLIEKKFGFSLEDNAPISDIAVHAKED